MFADLAYHTYNCNNRSLLLSSPPQIDDFNILLDCGWDEDFTVEKLDPVIK